MTKNFLGTMKMNIRNATIEDAKDLFDLRNDPAVYKNCFTPEPVNWENHIKWLKKTLSDENCMLLIAEQEGIFVGQIRLDKEWVTSISLAEPFRGKGLSANILEETSQKVEGCVTAYIKEDNAISIKAFKRAGFVKK